MQISGLEKVNSCFQPDIRRASRFNIGSAAKVIELPLKSPAGRRLNRYTFFHCVTNAGFRPNFCIFQERSTRPGIACWSVPIVASSVLAREE